MNYIDPWGESAISVGPFILPGPDLIGPSTGARDIINPNGTEKKNKTKTESAGIKEPANNPTAQVNKAETGNGEKEEEVGKEKEDYPENPDDWIPPEGVVEEIKAKIKSGGKHRHWVDKDGNIVRRWDKGDPNKQGWRAKDHWHGPEGQHI